MHNIRSLRGIGDTRAKLFEQKGINTVEELLYFFPRNYEDRGFSKDIAHCRPGEELLVKAVVVSEVKETRIRKNMTLYSMTVGDDTGIMTVTWYNNRFVKKIFKKGDQYYFYGKINPNSRKKEMLTPVYERVGKEQFTGKIIPIYPLWGNLTQKFIQTVMSEALEVCGEFEEYLPKGVIKEYKLCDINYAIKNIHFPDTFKDFETARYRLVFEELFMLQLALLCKKETLKGVKREPFYNTECMDEFLALLPFEMTRSQKNVCMDILSDLKKDVPMNRLVQGDVGSGKTAVAAAAMYVAVKNGYQAAIMAPTEILAGQHYGSFCEFFKETDIKICLLTSSTKKKKELYDEIKQQKYDIIIGTHALIADSVEYANLGLVIADEQHRFGVTQRAKLMGKGNDVHTLVMTATPIPRTLALILYGDLDISVINELPPGRIPVKTYAVGEDMRKRIYLFLEKNLKEGMQCYVVCPLIEETQKSDLKNAVEIHEKMKKLFPDYNVGIIHGKMNPKEKEEIMMRFARGEIRILVSTTVIEVGVNVPNSNIMIIENAERFGLSQLHQLRGRVGRGKNQAFCIMFAHGSNEIIKKRMEIMCTSNDGFYVSEEDLKLRGPGDFFGTRQHGIPELKIANLFSDMQILKKAQSAAKKIIECNGYPGNIDTKLYEKIREMFREGIVSN